MSWTASIIDVLAPGACPACDGPGGVDGATVLCARCDALAPRLPRAIAAPSPAREAWVIGAHEGPLGALVRRGKYRPSIGVMDELGQRLSDAAAGRLPRIDVVTHVPVPWQRRMTRGFDQAEILARAVAHRLGVPHRTLLRRIATAEQAGRGLLGRRVLGRGAFHSRNAAPGQRVLLVDDVITTGTTAATCATELLGDGAAVVYVIAVSAPLVTLRAPFPVPSVSANRRDPDVASCTAGPVGSSRI